jgi:hypothetical protein
MRGSPENIKYNSSKYKLDISERSFNILSKYCQLLETCCYLFAHDLNPALHIYFSLEPQLGNRKRLKMPTKFIVYPHSDMKMLQVSECGKKSSLQQMRADHFF